MGIDRTILGALACVYEYRLTFAKALLIPVAVLLGLGIIPVQETGLVLTVFLTFLPLFIYAVLAITTHRIILLGPESTAKWGVYVPTKRELFFILYLIGIALCMIPFAFLSFIPVIGWGIAAVAMTYILSRLSLVFPAIATDRGWTLFDSWVATRDHQILMMVVVAVFPFVITIPEQLLSHLPYVGLLVHLLSVVTMVLVVAALSVAFQVIAEESNES